MDEVIAHFSECARGDVVVISVLTRAKEEERVRLVFIEMCDVTPENCASHLLLRVILITARSFLA